MQAAAAGPPMGINPLGGGMPGWTPSVSLGQPSVAAQGIGTQASALPSMTVSSDTWSSGVRQGPTVPVPSADAGASGPPSQEPRGGDGPGSPSRSSTSARAGTGAAGSGDSSDPDSDDSSPSSDSDSEVEEPRIVRYRSAPPIGTSTPEVGPSRGSADALDGLPAFTPEVLRRLASGLGLEYAQEGDVGHQGVLALGHRVGAQHRSSPALALPPDIEGRWKDACAASAPTFCRSLRVQEADYKKFFLPPSMDSDVARHLPSSDGKSTPTAYSPFWEERLDRLDGRARTAMRLSSFAWMVTNQVATSLRGIAGIGTEVDQAVELLASLVRSQLDHSMCLAKALVDLRRQNALSSLRSVFCSDLAEQLKDTEPTAENLFGAEFCKRVTDLANRLEHEEAVMDTAETLKQRRKSHSKKKKKKSSKGKKSSSSSAKAVSKGKASVPKPSTGQPSSSGKRKAGGTQGRAASSSKKTKKGKPQRS